MFELSIRRTYELLFEQMCQARRNKVDTKVSFLTHVVAWVTSATATFALPRRLTATFRILNSSLT